MDVLALFAFCFGIAWLILERGCRDFPPPFATSWFSVLPHLRLSKKKRGRGVKDSPGYGR